MPEPLWLDRLTEEEFIGTRELGKLGDGDGLTTFLGPFLEDPGIN